MDDKWTALDGLFSRQEEEQSEWDALNNIFQDTELPESKPSYIENLARAGGAGLLKMGGNLVHSIPLAFSQVFDTDVMSWNYRKKLLNPDAPDVDLSYQDIANHPLNPAHYAEQAGQLLNQSAQNIAPKVEFDRGIADSLLHGDVGQGLEQLSYAVAENLPQFALATATTALGVPQASLPVLGASSAGGAYADLQGSGMDQQAIRDNALLKGIVEMGMEKYFTLPLLEEALKSPFVKDQVQQGAVSMLKNMGSGFLQEGGSEFATQVGQNAIDILTKNPRAPGLFDGSLDSLLVGGVMGSGARASGDITRFGKRSVDSLPQESSKTAEMQESIQETDQSGKQSNQSMNQEDQPVIDNLSDEVNTEKYGRLKIIEQIDLKNLLVEDETGKRFKISGQELLTEPTDNNDEEAKQEQTTLPPEDKAVEKQPWEMSAEEYEEYRWKILPHKIDFVPATESKLGKSLYGREASVYRAIMEGKNVPETVLNDFTDLKELNNQLVENVVQPIESTEPMNLSTEKTLKMEDRTYRNVGSRKVKAYQFEHPEVREYIQSEAAILQGELKDSIKGERFPIRDKSGEIISWKGQKKFVSDSIQRIQDATGATYQQIEDALQRLIDDEGQENMAIAKRIELIIDDNLTNGYRAFAGFDVPPNEDYVREKQKIEGWRSEIGDVQQSLDNMEEDMGSDEYSDLWSESKEKELSSKEDRKSNSERIHAERSIYDNRRSVQIELPEIVEVARRLNEGKYPHIMEKLRSRGTLGRFVSRGDSGRIDLRADIFLGQPLESTEVVPGKLKKTEELLRKIYQDDDNIVIKKKYLKGKSRYEVTVYQKDPTIAAKVLAHEIGHLIDWLPDKEIRRGNILGRIASLKGHLKWAIDEIPLLKERDIKLIETRGKKKGGVPQITRNEIMEELKKVSMIWKPFNPEDSSAYTGYRFSSPELYADAISVLFNEPALLESEAPIFFNAFMSYLDRKPVVKAVYDDIQKRLTNVELINEKRLLNIRKMFDRDAVIRNKLHQEKQANVEEVVDSVMRWLVDKDHAILKIARTMEKQGGQTKKIAQNARYALEESKYISSEIENYLYEIGENILSYIKSSELTVDDLGIYMFFERVRHERNELANPLGQTELTAGQTLETFQNRIGDDRFNLIQNAVQKYREYRSELILNRVEEARTYSAEMLELMRSNEHYARFSVLSYLENRYGKGATARVYKQVGTLSEVSNPFVATVLQDISMLRAAKINEAKTATLIMLKDLDSGVIEDAETFYSLDRKAMLPREPTDPKKGMITVLVDGKPQSYYVAKNIAESFEYQPFESTKLAQIWSLVNQPLREILVSKNPYWMIRNVIRDFQATVKNIPEVRLRNIPKLMKKYREAYREAWKTVFKGERSGDVSEMMKGWMLIPDRVYSPRERNFDNEIERLVEEFELDPEAHNRSKSAVRKVYNYLNKLGRISEIGGKIAGYKYLKELSSRSEKEIAHIVRTRVGTPDYKRQGSLQTITNNVFMFSNVNKEGMRSSWESFRENKGAYVWKTLTMNMLPKFILTGALAGGSELLKEIIEGISEYDKRNYSIIPLGLNRNGESVYLRIPQDYEGQFFGALTWDLVTGKLSGKGGVLDVMAEENPYQLNPYLQVGQDIFQYYVRGLNPYDSYRGRQVISYSSFKKGGMKATRELLQHEWRQLGLNVIYNPNGTFEYSETGFEKLLQVFPFSLLGTFLKVSDYGHEEKENR